VAQPEESADFCEFPCRQGFDVRSLHCPSCGYDLTGLPENRCPECGGLFDRNELARQSNFTLWKAMRQTLWLPGAGAAAGVVCMLAVIGLKLPDTAIAGGALALAGLGVGVAYWNSHRFAIELGVERAALMGISPRSSEGWRFIIQTGTTLFCWQCVLCALCFLGGTALAAPLVLLIYGW
jgi:hypothetical protein